MIMSILDVSPLLRPLSADAPCGPDLEYTPEYVELLQCMRGTPDVEYGKMHRAAVEPDWKAVKAGALRLLERSRDLRLAVHLARASAALHGYAGLDGALALIEGLLNEYWDHVHPQLDADDHNDPTERINTLLALDDREGLCLEVHAAPLVASSTHGRYSLRDLDILAGVLSAPSGLAADGQAPIDAAQVDAAFKAAPLDELKETCACLERALARLDAIGASLVDRVGHGKGASLSMLPQLLCRAAEAMRERIAAHPGYAIAAVAPAGVQGDDAPTVTDPAALAGREDVARLLDRICDYYAVAEPGSPLPLLLRRARRLVGLDFVSILADLSPQSLPEIQHLAGSAGE
jgi:type VI secretion system protein ImpA